MSRRGRMVVECTTTCAIVAYPCDHLSCEFELHFSGYSNFRHKSSTINEKIGLLKVCFLLGFIGWNLYLM
jgi:hypothetical protein